MEFPVGDVAVHYVEHGTGRPVVVLHGAGVDHREAEACFEEALGAHGGLRRIYPDLPGMGRTPAPPAFSSADDVLDLLLDLLLGFIEGVVGSEPTLLVGHSAGAFYAQGLTAREPELVAGLALVCPLLAETGEVPEHQPVVSAPDLGDAEFRAYFVVQTPAMLERYRRYVEPAIPLADSEAMERIGEQWELTETAGPAYGGPVLVVAGRQDSTVGYAAAVDLLEHYPRATLAVIDGAGHALPHERPEVLAGLLEEWLRSAATPPLPRP